MTQDNRTGAVLEMEEKKWALPEPEPEHDWLLQLAGEWTAEVSIFTEPEAPPLKSRGSQSIRTVGGFWITAENRGSFMDRPFAGHLTLGYDPDRRKYIGTWIDSMSSHLWLYEGTLDRDANRLTLLAQGPTPGNPGQSSRFKEVMELRNPNRYLYASSMQNENGDWITTMTIDYRRR